MNEPITHHSDYHRPALKRQEDRAEILRLLRRGWTQVAIAEKLGVPRRVVTRDYQVVVKSLVETRDETAKELVELKLEEYAEVKREAWEAWEKSKGDSLKRQVEEWIDTEGHVHEKLITTREAQVGDPAYLKTVLACIQAERSLLGINPAKEVKAQVTSVNWDILANGIPDGPVPDVIEGEIIKAMTLSNGSQEREPDDGEQPRAADEQGPSA